MNKLSKIVKLLVSPAFIVLVLVAGALWFVSRLSHTYSSQITIPVELSTDYGSEAWVESKPLAVRVLVQGDGRDLLLYKLGLGPKVIVPVSALQLVQDEQSEPYLYSVVDKSMERALAAEQNRFTIMMITDTIPRVRLSMMGQARLPIVADIDVDCAAQYMVRGGVTTEPDSISVRAPLSVLDTLRAIRTEPLVLSGVNASQSDAIGIHLPQYVVSQTSLVRYVVNVVGYTEQRYRLPVSTYDGADAVPSTVELIVRVPLNVPYPESVKISAMADSVSVGAGSPFRRVLIYGLPPQATVASITPEFVETYQICM